MGVIADKWTKKWKAWNDKAQPILVKNAKECERLDGVDKMECIAEKNADTVTKSALGLTI